MLGPATAPAATRSAGPAGVSHANNLSCSICDRGRLNSDEIANLKF